MVAAINAYGLLQGATLKYFRGRACQRVSSFFYRGLAVKDSIARLILLLAVITGAVVSCSKPQTTTTTGATTASQPTAEQTIRDAVDVYIYGYPLVTMDMTRKQTTNVATAQASRAPMGQFIRMRAYPTAAYRDVPGANTDTLYTMVWLDVSNEPWILSIPDMGNRYYMMPMLDAWTNVFQSPGSRTTGGKAQKYAITGPSWTGKLPEGVTEYKSPSGLVWILGRIYCRGTEQDYAKVHTLQDQFSVVPLSSYGKPYTPPAGEVAANLDMKTTTVEQVAGLSVYDYFSYLAELMKANPPLPQDGPAVETMARIGLTPGKGFDPSKLNLLDQQTIKTVPKLALQEMAQRVGQQAPINGWIYFPTGVGDWGTDYLLRATTAWLGPGWNRIQDAVYPLSKKDAAGEAYDGAKYRYTIHIDSGQFPPVKGFWSLTMYDHENFLAQNALSRYSLSQRDKFVTNPDGSVDLYIQADSPGKGKDANWLPAPKAQFGLMLRLYWPTETPPSILDGTWKPPAVSKVE